MYRVQVTTDVMDQVSIYLMQISLDQYQQDKHSVLQLDGTDHVWQPVPIGVQSPPTLVLNEALAIEMCKALMETLGLAERSAEPAESIDALRQDYLEERKRVDRLLDLVEELVIDA